MSSNAWAKINLTLHVVGKRSDGYHLLDSLVVFADVYDIIEIIPYEHEHITLEVSGPYAAEIDPHNNTIIKAATLLREQLGIRQGVGLTLQKRLPVGAGIGGGSADAAATLKLLVQYWKADISTEALNKIGLQIGADVPSSLHGGALYMQGIGEVITPITAMPQFHLVLVNPGKPLLTKDVFAQYKGPYHTKHSHPTAFANQDECIDFLGNMTNDLQEPAIKLMPETGEILRVLAAQDSCMLARMSGSGATCFGLFETRETANAVAQSIQTDHPHWWCTAATTIG